MEEVLTFSEWMENHVMVTFNLNGGAVITSTQAKKTFKTITNPTIISELKDKPGVLLLSIFKENFDWIQTQHQKLLKEFDENQK